MENSQHQQPEAQNSSGNAQEEQPKEQSKLKIYFIFIILFLLI